MKINPTHSLLKWLGGKSRLVTTIVPIIDQTPHTTYVEPFAGGGKIFFNKTMVQTNVLNDINPLLMEFYTKVQTTSKTPQCVNYGSKQEFLDNNAKLKSGTWDICNFIIANKNSYSGLFTTHHYPCIRTPTPEKNKGICGIKYIPDIYPVYHQKLKQTNLHNTDYTKMIKQYDSSTTFFYADPPYISKSSKRYNTDLDSVTPEKIAENFHHIKGKALISFNDSPEIRKVFTQRGFYVHALPFKYQAHGTNTGEIPEHSELLITNDLQVSRQIQQQLSIREKKS